MMLNNPRISIVIPSLNQSMYLRQNIKAIVNQKYDNIEIIIIDGGSTDSTIDVIKEYEKYIAYWVSEKDRGQSHAINKGLEVATGDFIGWQNSDDMYTDGAFNDFYEVFLKNPDYDLYYSNVYKINEKSEIVGRSFYLPNSLFYYKYRGMTLSNQASFFKREIVQEIGGVDESLHYAMDREFFLRIFLHGYKSYFTPSYWGAFRLQEESKTCKGNDKKWKNERFLIREKFNIGNGIQFKVCNKVAMAVRMISLLRYYSLKEMLSYSQMRIMKSFNK